MRRSKNAKGQKVSDLFLIIYKAWKKGHIQQNSYKANPKKRIDLTHVFSFFILPAVFFIVQLLKRTKRG